MPMNYKNVFESIQNVRICTYGLPSDVSINIGDMSFHLHKFSLLSRSGLLEKLIEECCSGGESISIRCAAEYLRMTDGYGDGNLVKQIESFLNEVLGNWADSIRALEACEEVFPYAEELHIVSRCIDFLAMKACADPSLFNWPFPGYDTKQSSKNTGLWNGILAATKKQPTGEDWWYEDVSFLSLPLYKRLILAIE
ncbi:hypothetical protein REPUB_Repub02eG0245900 [Reevesia pubescens]